jgi:hypothetical protein
MRDAPLAFPLERERTASRLLRFTLQCDDRCDERVNLFESNVYPAARVGDLGPAAGSISLRPASLCARYDR